MSRNPSRRNFRSRALFVPAALVAGGLLAGCSSSDKAARPLTAEQFAARNGVTLDGRNDGQPIDRAGAVPYDMPERGTIAPPAVTAQDSVVGNVENPNPDPRPREINAAVGQAVSRPYSEQGNAKPVGNGTPTEQIDLREPGHVGSTTSTGGQSLDVFFVVMEVSGKPIFSDKVLKVLEKPLAVEAKKHDRTSFQNLAAEYIARQVQLQKLEELEVAGAEKELTEDDKRLAAALTTQWRMSQITAAGGSLEVARQRATQDGWDFDELVTQQYRVHLVKLFYQKRVNPLVQVSAAAMREYYNRNKDTEFSKPGRVKFRMIMINPASGRFVSKEDATNAAEQVRKRAETEDFATLASDPKINDDNLARENAGFVRSDGWVQIGSFPNEEVEKAVQAPRPGQVTGVIQRKGSDKYYIAKLEAIDEAQVQPFEDQLVQDKIKQKLQSQQIQAMREKNVRELEKKSVSVRKQGAMQALLDIVMQRYPEWSGKGPAKGG